MSTTDKGDSLEDQVFDYFSKEIEEGRFLAPANNCKIFKQKGYYSKDRGKDITFDIASEISFPGAATHSILCLFECKNYAHRVPVDDIEEFYAKTQQITPSNTKAIVVSTNAFQAGSFNYAKSKGIGLLRYFGPNSVEWILHRSHSNSAGITSTNARAGLYTQDFVSQCFEFYCYANDLYTNSIERFFLSLIKEGAEEGLFHVLLGSESSLADKSSSVPFLESKRIEEHCNQLLISVGYKKGKVPLEEICQVLATTSGVRVEHKTLAPGILGTISFNPAIIKVDPAQTESTGRTRFTVAHEIGHLQLGHAQYLSRDVVRLANIELDKPFAVEIKDMARMEWQANYFASCLLLPENDLLWSAQQIAHQLGIADRGHRLIYLDEQPCNQHTFRAITGHLMRKFDVSRAAVRIRLKELGLLVEPLNSVKSFAAVAAQLFK